MPALARTVNCLFDGTYLDHSHGLIAFMGVDSGIIAGVYGLSERPKDLQPFFRSLAAQGICPASVTVDGNRAVIRALREQWPTIIIQRCLVHVQRQGLMWCRRFPKRLDACKLRNLFLAATAITTKAERNVWLTQLASWESRYGSRIAASRETGWVFSDLKRARCMVLGALPDLFHYLDHPDIPRTTNCLEGYFGRLKDRYHDHRGLAQTNRSAYFQWYFYLCPR
jgi:transposase-like protein